MSTRGRPLGRALRAVGTLARLLRAVIAATLILGLLALNVATLLVPAVYDALRTAATAVATRLGAEAQPDGRTRTPADADAERTPRSQAEADLEAERRRADRLFDELVVERDARRVAEADLDALRRQRDEAAEAIDGLSSRILRRAARGAARSPGILIASAIPIGGTAVDLAGTALDLNDACDMARDMAALRREMDLAQAAEVGPICATVGTLPSLDVVMDPPDVVPCTVISDLEEGGQALEVGTCAPPPEPLPPVAPREPGTIEQPRAPLGGD